MRQALKTLDLFSGIGGFALAAQMVGGIETTQFVEINPFCQRVLKKHYPGVPVHGDIKTYSANLGQFDLVTFGFPCQDVSDAGKRQGIKEGTRSGLFYEAMRIVRLVRPRYIVVENVAALLSRGMGIVLAELSKAGYDAEWAVVSCADLGGSHLRERVWIVACPNSLGQPKQTTWEPVSYKQRHYQASKCNGRAELYAPVSGCEVTANSESLRQDRHTSRLIHCGSAKRFGLQDRKKAQPLFCGCDDGLPSELASFPCLMGLDAVPDGLPFATDSFSDEVLSYRKEAIEAYGNAVSPQVAAIALQRVLNLSHLL